MTLYDLGKVLKDSTSLDITFPSSRTIYMNADMLWTLDPSVQSMPVECIVGRAGSSDGIQISLGNKTQEV